VRGRDENGAWGHRGDTQRARGQQTADVVRVDDVRVHVAGDPTDQLGDTEVREGVRTEDRMGGVGGPVVGDAATNEGSGAVRTGGAAGERWTGGDHRHGVPTFCERGRESSLQPSSSGLRSG
jgi:hypothetical protein